MSKQQLEQYNSFKLVNLFSGKLGAKERDQKATSSVGNDFFNVNCVQFKVLILVRLP